MRGSLPSQRLGTQSTLSTVDRCYLPVVERLTVSSCPVAHIAGGSHRRLVVGGDAVRGVWGRPAGSIDSCTLWFQRPVSECHVRVMTGQRCGRGRSKALGRRGCGGGSCCSRWRCGCGGSGGGCCCGLRTIHGCSYSSGRLVVSRCGCGVGCGGPTTSRCFLGCSRAAGARSLALAGCSR